MERSRSRQGPSSPTRVAESGTLAYYDREAAAYAEATRGIDCSHAHRTFAARLSPGSAVLDAGCGSGRDTAALQAMGYHVTAMDASPALAREAQRLTGQRVLVGRHQDVAFERSFDGIWAMATLLHVPLEELPGVFARYHHALKPGGTMYCSFKVGERNEPEAEGRWFTDMTQKRLLRVLGASGCGWVIEQFAESPDARRPEVTWLEIMLTALPD